MNFSSTHLHKPEKQQPSNQKLLLFSSKYLLNIMLKFKKNFN